MARVWAQAVSSPRCAAWAKPLPVNLGNDGVLQVYICDKALFHPLTPTFPIISLHIYQSRSQPPSSSGSAGSSLALHDLQLSQLDPSEFIPLTEPVVVFQMDLACTQAPIPLTDQKVSPRFHSTLLNVVTCTSCKGGNSSGNCFWRMRCNLYVVRQNFKSMEKFLIVEKRWDCWTDPDCSVLLSCAPSFASPHLDKSKDEIPWRDHWMQAVYYPQVHTPLDPAHSKL